MKGVTAPIAAPLDIAYLDTAPRDLSFALGLPAHPALATRDVVADGLRVHLRLLGASHQVFAGPVRETVACLRGAGSGGCPAVAGDALPLSAAEEMDGWSYQFRARTLRYTGSAFHSEVSRLRGRLDRSRTALIGVFPGEDHAVTAMVVRSVRREADVRGSSPRWRTPKPYAGVDPRGGGRPLTAGGSAGAPAGAGAGRVGRRQVAWRTWHTYPQTGEVVETHSWMVER